MMPESNKFHLSSSAAEAYQHQKVPSIFAPMAEATLDAIALPRQADVLDVACGTGAVARAVAVRLVEPSRLTGTDLNPAMIEIAQRESPAGPHSFKWAVAPAEAQPFESGTFTLAFCQQGLQFFPDKLAALAEIQRVLGPGGRLILTCWAAVPPFFEIVSEVVGRHIDKIAAKKVVEPFVWNDGNQIRDLLVTAGFDCPAPIPLPVIRHMSAAPDAMREEMLATPNEPALRAAGDAVIDTIVNEVLDGVKGYRSGDFLAMPQQAHLFDTIVH